MTDADYKVLSADARDLLSRLMTVTAERNAALAEIDRLRAAAAEERHHCESALRVELEHVAEAVMGAPVERVDPSAVAAEARRLRAAIAKGDADDVSDWRRFAKMVVGDYADSHGADDCEAEYLRLYTQRTEDAAAFARDEIAALRAEVADLRVRAKETP